MDTWNPLLAETYVKRVPFWQAALVLAGCIALLLAVIFTVTVMLFSLEKMT